LEHKTGIDLTVSSTLKKPSKNYTCFVSRRFGLFLIHLQSENKAIFARKETSSQERRDFFAKNFFARKEKRQLM